MGGNYQKGLYNQLMDVMARLEVMESEHKKDQKEIARLTAEVESLQKENSTLRTEVARLTAQNAVLREENAILRKENQLLRDDNERMKRILGNDHLNSSVPPSAEPPWKAPNTYNSRKPTKKRQGAQCGHKGRNISKAEVEEKIREGVFTHRVEEVGDTSKPYVTRYRLDIHVETVATEVRIHAGDDGKYCIPQEYRADVSYGDTIKAVSVYLYSEGVVSIDRICDFLNSLSGDALCISAGSVYGFCNHFGDKCERVRPVIETALLNSPNVCTDATTVTTNGKQGYIRNFSTGKYVLYCPSEKKDLPTLEGLPLLKGYAGTLVHDHETALYHFGTDHAECNAHLLRYLRKNTEETGNTWSSDMASFLCGMNRQRDGLIQAGAVAFPEGKPEEYSDRYNEILEKGKEQNKKTHGRIAKKEEKALLNRLKKYEENHMLFLYDFQVPFTNNMSEKDLRICKNREKMAGGFRSVSGKQMYCSIMSFIETVKRQKKNIFQSITALMNGSLVID